LAGGDRQRNGAIESREFTRGIVAPNVNEPIGDALFVVAWLGIVDHDELPFDALQALEQRDQPLHRALVFDAIVFDDHGA
jgi:hypothetical protein